MHYTVRWYQSLRTLVDLQHGVWQAPLTLRSSALDEHVVGLEGHGGMLVRPQGGNPVGGTHLHHSGNLSMGGALQEFGDWYAYHTALSSNPHTLTQLICGDNLATTAM